MSEEKRIVGRTVVDAAFEAMQEGLVPTFVPARRGDAGASELLIVPKGMQVVDPKPYLDKYLPAPERRSGTTHHTELKTWLDFVNRFKGAPSIVFAVNDRSAPKLHCVFNFHPEGDKQAEAGFRDHRASYHFPLSDEWRVWMKHNEKGMSQGEFAEFIEDRILDIVPPPQSMTGDTGEVKTIFPPAVTRYLAATKGRCATPAEMVTLSRGLHVHANEKAKQQVNLQTGEIEMAFETTHAAPDGGKIDVPSIFLLGIPIFDRGPLYTVVARLRYRITGGSVSWFYQLHRPDVSFDHAFDEALQATRAETELPVFIGSGDERQV